MSDAGIQKLVALAADESQQSREALSDELIDLCLTPNHTLKPEEKEIAGHILIRLTRSFEVEVRGRLAVRLAHSQLAPKELIQALMLDEILVASPVIMHSPLLDEQDLIVIINGKTREHRMRTAMRSGITAAVTTVLVNTGEPDVLVALAKNQSAEIAETAMAYMVAESKSLKELRGPLVERADLPEKLAQKMLSFVSAALKKEILSRFEIDPASIDGALGDFQTPPYEAPAAAGTNNKAQALIAKMHASGELSVTRVIAFLREKRLNLFLEGMAALTGLETNTVANLSFESEGQGLAVLCRAIGADRSQFATAMLLLERGRTGKAVPAARLQTICSLFDTLTGERATATLDHWRGKLSAGNIQSRKAV